jgi:glycerol uptake facilitator-like aquaporin
MSKLESHPGKVDVYRCIVAEALGTAFLLAAVVGSGIMGERLAGGSVVIALLVNTIATGAALVALILGFGPISGGHFNPAVTLVDASQGGVAWRHVPAYLVAQMAGAFAGVAAAHLMFSEPVFFASHHVRSGGAQLFSEFVATFGLLSVIWGCARLRSSAVPFAVGAYITAAYWFTASTFCWHPARRRSRIHRCPARRCGCGHGSLSLAGTVAPQRCGKGR